MSDAIDDLIEELRTVVLEPGQFVLIEAPTYMTAEHAERLRSVVPEELRGRVAIVAGRVHILAGGA